MTHEQFEQVLKHRKFYKCDGCNIWVYNKNGPDAKRVDTVSVHEPDPGEFYISVAPLLSVDSASTKRYKIESIKAPKRLDIMLEKAIAIDREIDAMWKCLQTNWDVKRFEFNWVENTMFNKRGLTRAEFEKEYR